MIEKGFGRIAYFLLLELDVLGFSMIFISSLIVIVECCSESSWMAGKSLGIGMLSY